MKELLVSIKKSGTVFKNRLSILAMYILGCYNKKAQVAQLVERNFEGV